MPVKPSQQEEEYFVKQEFERRRQIEEEKQKKLAADEIKNLQELHYMKCPKCGMQLIEIDYQNIKIDECSHCEGLWLDANELEQILALKKGMVRSFLGVFKSKKA